MPRVISRKEMIRKLVAMSVDTALSESQRYWLSELFEKGFAGYGNFSDGQLMREMQMRGLIQADDVPDDEMLDDMIEDGSLDNLSPSLRDYSLARRELE